MHEQHNSVGAKSCEQAIPVESSRTGVQQMHHVVSVEPVTFHDKCFLPDHLFNRDKPHGNIKNGTLRRVVEPLLIDNANSVARAENHVDDEWSPIGLCEPVRELKFRAVRGRFQDAQRPVHVVAQDENVEILGDARDGCVMLKSVRTPNQKRYPGRLQGIHRRAVEGHGFTVGGEAIR